MSEPIETSPAGCPPRTKPKNPNPLTIHLPPTHPPSPTHLPPPPPRQRPDLQSPQLGLARFLGRAPASPIISPLGSALHFGTSSMADETGNDSQMVEG
ncbi:hypothetical protein ZWY2020_053472 [Hordeum vulgare]|nr:hypothetical protein ZWY2020_053472 [Hordeum vulgare]